MEQDESVRPEMGSAMPGPREGASVAADSGELAESTADGLSFGSLANPNRLRLGVSRSL